MMPKTGVKTTAKTTPKTNLADDLFIVVTRLARRLRRVADDGITPTQRSILTTIERRGPMTHGDIAATERVRPPTVTAAVDRLEEQALVLRIRDDDDRRVARVTLTDAGRELLAASRRERTAYLGRRLRALDAADRAAIATAAPALARLLDETQA